MLLVHEMIFDDVVNGSGAVYYSQSQLYTRLGAADAFAIQACTTGVAVGTTLTVQGEHSQDGEVWVVTGVPEINNVAIASDSSYYGSRNSFGVIVMKFLRFKIILAGASPQCGLKLYYTGRVRGPHVPPKDDASRAGPRALAH